jgi:hypothetical protein
VSSSMSLNASKSDVQWVLSPVFVPETRRASQPTVTGMGAAWALERANPGSQ